MPRKVYKRKLDDISKCTSSSHCRSQLEAHSGIVVTSKKRRIYNVLQPIYDFHKSLKENVELDDSGDELDHSNVKQNYSNVEQNGLNEEQNDWNEEQNDWNEEQDVWNEEQDVWNEEQDVFSEEQDVIIEEKNDLNEEQDYSNEEWDDSNEEQDDLNEENDDLNEEQDEKSVDSTDIMTGDMEDNLCSRAAVITWLLNEKSSNESLHYDNPPMSIRNSYFNAVRSAVLLLNGDQQFYAALKHLKLNPNINLFYEDLKHLILVLQDGSKNKLLETVLLLHLIYSLLQNDKLSADFVVHIIDALMCNLIEPVSRCSSGSHCYILKDIIADIIAILFKRYNPMEKETNAVLWNNVLSRLKSAVNYESPFNVQYGAIVLSLNIEVFMGMLSFYLKVYSYRISHAALNNSFPRQRALNVRNKLLLIFKYWISHWLCSPSLKSGVSENMKFITDPNRYIMDSFPCFCAYELVEYCIFPAKYMCHRMPPNTKTNSFSSFSYLMMPNYFDSIFNKNKRNAFYDTKHRFQNKCKDEDKEKEPFISQWSNKVSLKVIAHSSERYINYFHCKNDTDRIESSPDKEDSKKTQNYFVNTNLKCRFSSEFKLIVSVSPRSISLPKTSVIVERNVLFNETDADSLLTETSALIEENTSSQKGINVFSAQDPPEKNISSQTSVNIHTDKTYLPDVSSKERVSILSNSETISESSSDTPPHENTSSFIEKVSPQANADIHTEENNSSEKDINVFSSQAPHEKNTSSQANVNIHTEENNSSWKGINVFSSQDSPEKDISSQENVDIHTDETYLPDVSSQETISILPDGEKISPSSIESLPRDNISALIVKNASSEASVDIYTGEIFIPDVPSQESVSVLSDGGEDSQSSVDTFPHENVSAFTEANPAIHTDKFQVPDKESVSVPLEGEEFSQSNVDIFPAVNLPSSVAENVSSQANLGIHTNETHVPDKELVSSDEGNHSQLSADIFPDVNFSESGEENASSQASGSPLTDVPEEIVTVETDDEDDTDSEEFCFIIEECDDN